MSLVHEENVKYAREFLERVKKSEPILACEVHEYFKRMGFKLTSKNEFPIIMAFTIGALANEPQDSKWYRALIPKMPKKKGKRKKR